MKSLSFSHQVAYLFQFCFWLDAIACDSIATNCEESLDYCLKIELVIILLSWVLNLLKKTDCARVQF